MACSIPTVEDLEKWMNEDIPAADEDYAEYMLQVAADLIGVMAGCTGGITGAITSPAACRTLGYAIMDLALYLTVQSDNKTESFSPFSSETIGSYSYSKSAATINLAAQNQPTGIAWLDILLPSLQSACAEAAGLDSGVIAHTSTHIMPEAGVNRPYDFWQITDPAPTVGGGFWSGDPADAG